MKVLGLYRKVAALELVAAGTWAENVLARMCFSRLQAKSPPSSEVGETSARYARYALISEVPAPYEPPAITHSFARNSPKLIPMARAVVSARLSLGSRS